MLPSAELNAVCMLLAAGTVWMSTNALNPKASLVKEDEATFNQWARGYKWYVDWPGLFTASQQLRLLRNTWGIKIVQLFSLRGAAKYGRIKDTFSGSNIALVSFCLCFFSMPYTFPVTASYFIFPVWMLHFLPLLTLSENQYLPEPAGLANSVWNSVFLRRTPQSLEDMTQQALAKPLAVSCSITAYASKQGLGILLKMEWVYSYFLLHLSNWL